MTLFPNEDILTQEIESWKGFADCLCEEDRVLFLQMLDECTNTSIQSIQRESIFQLNLY